MKTLGKIQCPMCHYRFGKNDTSKDEIRKDIIKELIEYLEELLGDGKWFI
jgi:MoaA/NifB/PqqE/SkfB family radical SAM enzyme